NVERHYRQLPHGRSILSKFSHLDVHSMRHKFDTGITPFACFHFRGRVETGCIRSFRKSDSAINADNRLTRPDVRDLMPQQMSSIMEQEYAELLAYLDFYSTYVSGVDPLDPIHPANVMKQIVDKFGRAEALEGLKQAINDTVEDLISQPPGYVEKLDAA